MKLKKSLCLILFVVQVLRSLNQLKLAVVEKEWLLDSLGGWQIRPLLPYMQEGVSHAHLTRAGYHTH